MAQPCCRPLALLLALALLARPICSVRDEDDQARGPRLPGLIEKEAEEQGERRIVQAKAESPEKAGGREEEEEEKGARRERGAEAAEEEGKEDSEGSALELTQQEQRLAAKHTHAGEARQEEEDEKAKKLEGPGSMLPSRMRPGHKNTKKPSTSSSRPRADPRPPKTEDQGATDKGKQQQQQQQQQQQEKAAKDDKGKASSLELARHEHAGEEEDEKAEKEETPMMLAKRAKLTKEEELSELEELEKSKWSRRGRPDTRTSSPKTLTHGKSSAQEQGTTQKGTTQQHQQQGGSAKEQQGKPAKDDKGKGKASSLELARHEHAGEDKKSSAEEGKESSADEDKESSLLELRRRDQLLAAMRTGEARQEDAPGAPGAAAPPAEAKAPEPAAEDAAASTSDAAPAQGAEAAAPAAQDAASAAPPAQGAEAAAPAAQDAASAAPPAQGAEAAAPAAQDAVSAAPPAQGAEAAATAAQDAASTSSAPPTQGAEAATPAAQDAASTSDALPAQGAVAAVPAAQDAAASPEAAPGQGADAAQTVAEDAAASPDVAPGQGAGVADAAAEDEAYPRAMIEGEVERRLTAETKATAEAAKRVQPPAVGKEAGASIANNVAEKALETCEGVVTDPQGQQPVEEWREVWEKAGRDYLPEEEEAAFAKMGLSDSNMSASASCQEHPRALVILGPMAVGKSFSLDSLMKQKALWLKEKAGVWHHFDAVLMDGTTMRKEHRGYKAFMDKGLEKGCIASQAHKRVQPYLAKLENKLLEKATGENCKRNVLFPATCANVKNCTWDVEVLVKRNYAVTVVAVAAPFKDVLQRAKFSHKRVGDVHEISDFVQSLVAFLPVMSVGNDRCILVNNTVAPVQAVMNFTCPAEAHFTRLNAPLSAEFSEVAKKTLSISGVGKAELLQAEQAGDILSKVEELGLLPKALGEGATGGGAGEGSLPHVQSVNVGRSHRTLKAMKSVLGLGDPEDGNASNGSTTAAPGTGHSGAAGLGGLSLSLPLALVLVACLLP